MPKGCIERRVTWPGRSIGSCRTICTSRIVLKLPLRGSPRVCLGYIGKVCLNTGDGEGGCIDLVQLIAGVIACERGDARSNETHCKGLGVVDHCGVAISGSVDCVSTVGEVVVEDLKLVFVRMAEENTCEFCQCLKLQ